MIFIELPQETWTVAINPTQVVMVSPLTDRRRHDPRSFSRAEPVPDRSVITLCSPLEDGEFWLTVDLSFDETLKRLRGVGA